MVNVTSEIGRLRQALVHEPGLEVDRMVPTMMEQLLFDDILYGDRARDEHARFRRVMQLLGVEVIEVADLLAETLDLPEARGWVLDVLMQDLSSSHRDALRSLSGRELVATLVTGARQEPVGGGIEVEDLWGIPPLPNWCFQRDPQVVLGDGVVFCSMAAAARHSEAMLNRAVFRYHPDFRSIPVLFDPVEASRDPSFLVHAQPPYLEGGDVLVFSRDVVAVGLSERTNRVGARALARALARSAGGPRWMVAVQVPRRRAYMHLDTLITQVDHDACLVYPPVVLADGADRARVFEIDLHSEDLAFSPRDDLLGCLARRGVDMEPIPCGGDDPVTQQREQWTDGSNALALAPGVITLYDRNRATAETLADRGFRIVAAEDLLLGREEIELERCGRVCILISSHEISRARGGPHCLVHPLLRDDVA